MYHIPDQTRYEEFRAHPVEQLESEAALLRVCIEKAMCENRPALVNSLVATYAKIASVHQSAQIRAGVLLEKDRAFRICDGIVKLVLEALKSRQIPEHDQIVEEIIDGIDPLFDEVKNEKLLLPAPHRSTSIS